MMEPTQARRPHRTGPVMLIATVILCASVATQDRGATNSWNLFSTKTGDLRSNQIRLLEEAGDGAVWVATPAGLQRFARGRWSEHNKETKSLAHNDVRFLKLMRDGALWVGTTGGGAARFLADEWVTYNREKGNLPENRVYGLIEGGDGVPWVLTATSMTGLKAGKQFSIEIAPVTLPADRPVASAVDGTIWLAQADSQIVELRWERPIVHSAASTKLAPAQVTAMAALAREGIWVGTALGHIARFQNQTWSTFEGVGHHFNGSAVNAISACGSVGVCVVSEAGQLALISGNSVTLYGRFSMVPEQDLSVIVRSASPEIWRSRPIGDVCRQVSGSSESASPRVTASVRSRDGNLWLGGTDGTVWSQAGIGCSPTQLGGRAVTELLQAADGSIWAGTESGVYRVNGGQRFPIDEPLLRNVEVRKMLEGRDGKVWIATFDHGLARFTPSLATLRIPSTVNGSLVQATLVADAGPTASFGDWILHFRVADDPGGFPPTFSRTSFNRDGVANIEIPANLAGSPIHLEAFASDSNGTIARLPAGRITVTRRTESSIWWTAGRSFIAAQVVLWVVIFLVYPYSRPVQAVFLWNPQFRRVVGLWYIDLLIVAVPALGRRILRPFREQLLGELQPELLNEYYTHSTVVTVGPNGVREPAGALLAVLSARRGHILLQGASGSGKTHFVRYVVSKDDEIGAYVPARLCANGVAEAIVNLLPGHLNDQQFVEKLIFAGTLRVYIDGLNEVSAEVRGLITGFLQRYARGNVMVLTQPLAWTPPRQMATYELQTLTPVQALEYLTVKIPSDPETIKRCREFVQNATASTLAEEVLEKNRELLSIPFDLDLVIELMASNREPNLLALQHQFVTLAVERYETRTLRAFPTAAMGTVAYESRLAGTREVTTTGLDAELMRVVVERRLLTVRTDAEPRYFFRHDRLQDYFITQHFLEHPDAIDRHVSDVRFLGPYLLLAEQLPDVEAIALAARLTLVAAQAQDHSVADPFVLKLERIRRARVDYHSQTVNGA